jgi:hypothetical protein
MSKPKYIFAMLKRFLPKVKEISEKTQKSPLTPIIDEDTDSKHIENKEKSV